MTPFSCAADLARRQHRVITRPQLIELGHTPEAIRHLLRTERLWRVHRAVFALEGPLTHRGRSYAAVAAMGDRSMLSLFSAAVLASLWKTWPPRAQVTVAGQRGRKGPPQIDVHHSRTLMRSDVTLIDGIRTTTPRRTILDCAPHVDDRDLKRMLRAAEFEHHLDLATLDVRGAPANLQALLALYVRGSGLTGNELEALFLELVAALPQPAVQRSLDRYRVDFVWPELGLIVETDGRGAHDRSVAFTEDRRRDRRLKLEGFTVLRYTWAEIVYDAGTVLAELEAALAVCAR